MIRYPKVLLMSNDDEEAAAIEGVLNEHATIRRVRDLVEFQTTLILEEGSFDAIFCGWSFRPGTWSDALTQARQLCPDLPVLVFCPMGGEREWQEVLKAGAFDLLVAPYQSDRVLPVLGHALMSHDARRLRTTPPQYPQAS